MLPKESKPLQTPPAKQLLSKRKLITVLVVVLAIALCIVVATILFILPRKQEIIGGLVNNPLIQSPTPTPLPFLEMTIPYLRSRAYTSKLSELERVASNGSYTSYLTSYDSDGIKVNGLLTIPTGTEPEDGWPAIIFLHGYIPPTTYQTLEDYASYVDYLAQNGFVVFKIDLRGHGNSEGEPGGGYYGSDYVVDTLNAKAALVDSDFVNQNKIGLWGHSMAGNIAMRSFAAQPDTPAVVIWSGAVYTYEDQRKYGINDNSYRPPTTATIQRNRRQELFEEVGSPSAQSPFWQQVAPTNFLNDLKGAIQLNHAVDDEVVNIGYSRDLNALLDKTNVEHELNEYQSGGHNISGSAFNSAMQNTVEFFKKYLEE